MPLELGGMRILVASCCHYYDGLNRYFYVECSSS